MNRTPSAVAGDVLREGWIVGREDHPRRLSAKSPHDQRHHDARDHRGEPSTDAEHHQVEPTEAGEVGVLDEHGEPPSRTSGNGDADTRQ